MTTEPELPDSANPSGLDGIELIEYATARPRALGHALELMGFQLVARHRSRDVLLYRHGEMTVVINAHHSAPRHGAPIEAVRISGLRWFGLVPYVGPGRMTEWTEPYRELFAFLPIPDDQRFGIPVSP